MPVAVFVEISGILPRLLLCFVGETVTIPSRVSVGVTLQPAGQAEPGQYSATTHSRDFTGLR